MKDEGQIVEIVKYLGSRAHELKRIKMFSLSSQCGGSSVA